MPDSRDTLRSEGSAIVASAVAGAVVGAAGLALWLLSTADRRRRERRVQRLLHLSRHPGIQLEESETLPTALPSLDPQLHDRVQKLNQAIEEVRRQLERMQPQS
jgi:hypothetical protein